jgi:hypothetical protein
MFVLKACRKLEKPLAGARGSVLAFRVYSNLPNRDREGAITPAHFFNKLRDYWLPKILSEGNR